MHRKQQQCSDTVAMYQVFISNWSQEQERRKILKQAAINWLPGSVIAVAAMLAASNNE